MEVCSVFTHISRCVTYDSYITWMRTLAEAVSSVHTQQQRGAHPCETSQLYCLPYTLCWNREIKKCWFAFFFPCLKCILIPISLIKCLSPNTHFTTKEMTYIVSRQTKHFLTYRAFIHVHTKRTQQTVLTMYLLIYFLTCTVCRMRDRESINTI